MNKSIDISVYESDSILVGLAKDDERDRLEALLKGDPYNLTNLAPIRIAQAMIDKYRPGMFYLFLLIYALSSCLACL